MENPFKSPGDYLLLTAAISLLILFVIGQGLYNRYQRSVLKEEDLIKHWGGRNSYWDRNRSPYSDFSNPEGFLYIRKEVNENHRMRTIRMANWITLALMVSNVQFLIIAAIILKG